MSVRLRHPCLVGLAVFVATLASAEKATVLEHGRWQKIQAARPNELKGFAPRPRVKLSRYGGMATRRVKATGFFQTARVDGRWWLVDPEGCRFLSVGLCSVNLSNFDDGVLKEKFASEEKWADATLALLRTHGFNTLGRWSDWQDFRTKPKPIPYCTRLSFMSGYKNVRPPRNGQRGYPHLTMPVFDAEFEGFCDTLASTLAATKDDPWLLGHFSDNELPFRPNALSNYLALPPSDAGHKAARAWLAARGKTPARANARDQAGFLEHVARRYYGIVGKAIRKHDPNHLYIGSRIHGRCIAEPVFRGSKAVDVISVNYYHRWSPEQERMTKWLKASGRPFIASEWYAMSLESPKTRVRGAGFRVRTDHDRGLFYQNFTIGLLRHPACVGWHWFKYGGDQPGCHKGIVNTQFLPHQALLDLMKELNAQVYPLAGHFLGDRRR